MTSDGLPVIDVLRRVDGRLNQALHMAEEMGRELTFQLAYCGGHPEHSCWGLWIEHQDSPAGPPGFRPGQCSRGPECRVAGGGSDTHFLTQDCAAAFDGCPRCTPS